MFDVVTTVSLWELTKHATTWLINLNRAKDARKNQSLAAVRKVILAAKKTSFYLRHISDNGERDIQKEEEISVLWTELSFELADLELDKLAKRCRIKGKYWENPINSDREFIKKADISLEKMEHLANEFLAGVSQR